jgi:hypothetical protein
MANAVRPARAEAAIELDYRVWRTSFRVLVPNPAIAGYLQQLCRQFGAAPALDALELHVEAAPEGWVIRQDGAQPVVRNTERGAARHVEWRMVGIAARAERELVHWHAAALVRGEHTVLLPGKPGAGKSTLALALALQGFELLGEDVVFMDPESGVIHPFPRALRADGEALRRLAPLGLSYDAGQQVGQLLPASALSSWRTRPAPPLSHVLFVEWDRHAGVEVAPLTQAEAALELPAHSHTLRRLPRARWPILRIFGKRHRRFARSSTAIRDSPSGHARARRRERERW